MSIFEAVQNYISSLNYDIETSLENITVVSILHFESFRESQNLDPYIDDTEDFLKEYKNFVNTDNISSFDYYA